MPNATATRAPMQRKLSTRIIMGQTVNAALLEGAKNKSLYVLGGVARGIETGESDMGTWTRFKGEFVAKRLDTGEEMRSFKAHIPEPLQSQLLEELGTLDDSGRPVDEEGKPIKRNVEFVAEIGIQLDKETTIGFQYTATPVLEAAESDQLAGLLERAAAQNPNLLPAPKKSRSKKDSE